MSLNLPTPPLGWNSFDSFGGYLPEAAAPIVLSLSHGGETDPTLLPVYRQADLVRVTKDIWDDVESIEQSFNAWAYWQPHTTPGFWPDLDMIPFGRLESAAIDPEHPTD